MVLKNNFSFDDEIVHTIMETLIADMKLKIASCGMNIPCLINFENEFVDHIAMTCLLFLLLQDKCVPFEDIEWLDLFYENLKNVVVSKSKMLYAEHLKNQSIIQILSYIDWYE